MAEVEQAAEQVGMALFGLTVGGALSQDGQAAQKLLGADDRLPIPWDFLGRDAGRLADDPTGVEPVVEYARKGIGNCSGR